MYPLNYSLGFHWNNYRFALALMSLNHENEYKICDLVEADYVDEKQIENHIKSMTECEKVYKVPPLKLINDIIAPEIFKLNKFGYYCVQFNMESEIERLNLKLQNGSVIIDRYIADLIIDKLQAYQDYKNPTLAVTAMAIALHDFYQPGEIIRVNPNSRDFGNFEF